MARLCKEWDENACRIEDVTFERLRDFFRVRGKAGNLLDCTLPHLQLKLVVLDAKGRPLIEDIFHLTDRKLRPGEHCEFKIEGEWKRGMKDAKVTVWFFIKRGDK